jgi:hypothetical protein
MANAIAQQRNILKTPQTSKSSYLNLELFILVKKFVFYLVTQSL